MTRWCGQFVAPLYADGAAARPGSIVCVIPAKWFIRENSFNVFHCPSSNYSQWKQNANKETELNTRQYQKQQWVNVLSLKLRKIPTMRKGKNSMKLKERIRNDHSNCHWWAAAGARHIQSLVEDSSGTHNSQGDRMAKVLSVLLRWRRSSRIL